MQAKTPDLQCQSLQPGWTNHRAKSQQSCAFFCFNRYCIKSTAGLFTKQDVNRLHNFVVCLSLAAGAHHDVIVAAIASSEVDFLKLRRARDFLFRFGFAVDPPDVHRRSTLKLIESIAKRVPILAANLFHKIEVGLSALPVQVSAR